jgi:hypothetical protein
MHERRRQLLDEIPVAEACGVWLRESAAAAISQAQETIERSRVLQRRAEERARQAYEATRTAASSDSLAAGIEIAGRDLPES